MAKVKFENIAKKGITFKQWCDENRWTTTKLSKEFEKYGLPISPVTIWYWQKGKYKPRNQKAVEILSEICGFDVRTFSNFKK